MEVTKLITVLKKAAESSDSKYIGGIASAFFANSVKALQIMPFRSAGSVFEDEYLKRQCLSSVSSYIESHEKLLGAVGSTAALAKYVEAQKLDAMATDYSLKKWVDLYETDTLKRAREYVYRDLLKCTEAFANVTNFLPDTAALAGLPRELYQDSYLKVIQAFSESVYPYRDVLHDSVYRTIKDQIGLLIKTAEANLQTIPKDLLLDRLTNPDKSGFLFSSDVLQSAIAPFMREWALQVREVRLVSVDIEHEERPFLRAEYDRSTVIELLTAKIALEKAEPDISVSSSGEQVDPNGPFWGITEEGEYHAHYYGETLISPSNKSDNTQKGLTQALGEWRQSGKFTDEELYEIELEAQLTELSVRDVFGTIVHWGALFAIEVSCYLQKEKPVSAEEFQALLEKSVARLRELLPKPNEGRPKGTGLFQR